MESTVQIIDNFITECKKKSDEELIKFFENDQKKVIHSIFTLFEEKIRYPESFEKIIEILFKFAKSSNEKLRQFSLLFVPSLIYIYLSSISSGDKKNIGMVEVLLLTLYNMELFDEQGNPKTLSFRLPSLARMSVYHDPDRLGQASITPESVQRFEAGDTETVRWGIPKHIDVILGSNRLQLVAALLVVFNAHIAKLPQISYMFLCKAASQIVSQGFNRGGHHHHRSSSYGSDSSFGAYSRITTRIAVTAELLIELLHSVYFSIYNDYATLGMQALEDIHFRAQYELYSNVLLMSNAIKNSLQMTGASGQPNDSHMGISVAITPSTCSPISKSFITNASFRSKKLPDDIEPVLRGECEQDTKRLGPITEDAPVEEKILRGTKLFLSAGKEKRMANMSALVKRKEKDKNKEKPKADEKSKGDKSKSEKKHRESRHDSYREFTHNSESDSHDMAKQLAVQISDNSISSSQIELKSYTKSTFFDDKSEKSDHVDNIEESSNIHDSYVI